MLSDIAIGVCVCACACVCVRVRACVCGHVSEFRVRSTHSCKERLPQMRLDIVQCILWRPICRQLFTGPIMNNEQGLTLGTL